MNSFVALKKALQPGELPDLRSRSWRIEEWRSTWSQPSPPGVHGLSSTVFFLMHKLRLFSSCDYRAVLIYEGAKLIHRSIVFPKDPRIGFMKRVDLQVGNIFTDPAYRRQGLASIALTYIGNRYAGRQLWYFVSSDNAASLALAEKSGFTRQGITKVSRLFGIGYRYAAPKPAGPDEQATVKPK